MPNPQDTTNVPMSNLTHIFAQNQDRNNTAADVETATAAADKEQQTAMDDKNSTVTADKVLSTSANLAQLLPTGSVMAYQSLSASFTNQGECFPSNFWLSVCLITFLTATCIFFSFTDSVVHKDKVYYGVATPGRLNIFNLSRKEEQHVFRDLRPELKKRRLKTLDWVHAFFTAIVFLTLTAGDVGLQRCFFPDAGPNAKQLLKNMPLGLTVLSSFVFMIFPSKRRGIGSQLTHVSEGKQYGSAVQANASSPPSKPAAGQATTASQGNGSKTLQASQGNAASPPNQADEEPRTREEIGTQTNADEDRLEIIVQPSSGTS